MTVYNAKLVEALVLIRDGVNMALDVLEPEEPAKGQQSEYDIMQVKTVQVEGQRGFYLQATADNNKGNKHFEALLKDLEVHEGKMTRQGYWIWKFDKTTVPTLGMKLSKR